MPRRRSIPFLVRKPDTYATVIPHSFPQGEGGSTLKSYESQCTSDLLRVVDLVRRTVPVVRVGLFKAATLRQQPPSCAGCLLDWAWLGFDLLDSSAAPLRMCMRVPFQYEVPPFQYFATDPPVPRCAAS